MANTVASAFRQTRSFRHAADLPKEAWGALYQNEASTNIVLSFAKKASAFPRERHSNQLWVVSYDNTMEVEFVLSCTQGPLGDYPIFIASRKSAAQLAEEERRGRDMADALMPIIRRLLEVFPPQRVFSVFAFARVAKRFSEIFQAQMRPEDGIRALEIPYYDATFSYCTRETLRKPSDAVSPFPERGDVVICLRRADMDDLKELATMCKGFSETSWPFILEDAGAKLEAELMIINQQVWVHTVQRKGQQPEIACLVATTRESENVTAVTKVFTPEHWRGRGCAARLLHRVCQEILKKKTMVVLYVGNSDELVPARKVYHKIGFQGLIPRQAQQVPGVERWVEIGFSGTALGYW